MFKVLILQSMHSLSDERCEYLIKDRLSFMRFLGLGLADAVPDANTFWTFREALTRATIDGEPATGILFKRFDAAMKEGRIPEEWKAKPAKLAQKDRDARWTVKYTKAKPREDGAKMVDIAIPSFGYKNHIGIDRRHGLIRTWTVTNAAAHDGARLADLLDRGNTASDVWADTAYRSKTNEAHLAKRGFVSRIHVKKPQRRPMPDATRVANARKSRVRSAIEHVFAHEKGLMILVVRTIGSPAPA